MTFPAASAGENANNIRAAMIPTGKNRNTNGGGGSGGNINGSNTIDAARAASTRIETKLKHRTIIFLSQFPSFSKRSCYSLPPPAMVVVSDSSDAPWSVEKAPNEKMGFDSIKNGCRVWVQGRRRRLGEPL